MKLSGFMSARNRHAGGSGAVERTIVDGTGGEAELTRPEVYISCTSNRPVKPRQTSRSSLLTPASHVGCTLLLGCCPKQTQSDKSLAWDECHRFKSVCVRARVCLLSEFYAEEDVSWLCEFHSKVAPTSGSNVSRMIIEKRVEHIKIPRWCVSSCPGPERSERALGSSCRASGPAGIQPLAQ